MPDLIQRRDLLKVASAAFIGLTSGRRNWAMPTELVQNVAKADNWTPAFFNPHQNETVMRLTDLIIPETDTPGAKQANVHRYIDLFLSIKSPADQKQFTDGLISLDDYARQTYKYDFVACGETEQTAILNRIASMKQGDPALEGHKFFDEVKTMTAAIYYSTPEGYRELSKYGPPPSTFACGPPSETIS